MNSQNSQEQTPHCHCQGHMPGNRRRPSSYLMHNSDLVFDALGLKDGDVLMDIGCGPGDYSVRAARSVGSSGSIYALDSNNQMLVEVGRQAAVYHLDNITLLSGSFTDPFPVGSASVDICLLSTSLHCVDLTEQGGAVFREVARVLKPSGQVFVLECKKEEMSFGPPLQMRISADEVRDAVAPLGFCESAYLDLGINYLIAFNKKETF